MASPPTPPARIKRAPTPPARTEVPQRPSRPSPPSMEKNFDPSPQVLSSSPPQSQNIKFSPQRHRGLSPLSVSMTGFENSSLSSPFTATSFPSHRVSPPKSPMIGTSPRRQRAASPFSLSTTPPSPPPSPSSASPPDHLATSPPTRLCARIGVSPHRQRPSSPLSLSTTGLDNTQFLSSPAINISTLSPTLTRSERASSSLIKKYENDILVATTTVAASKSPNSTILLTTPPTSSTSPKSPRRFASKRPIASMAPLRPSNAERPPPNSRAGSTGPFRPDRVKGNLTTTMSPLLDSSSDPPAPPPLSLPNTTSPNLSPPISSVTSPRLLKLVGSGNTSKKIVVPRSVSDVLERFISKEKALIKNLSEICASFIDPVIMMHREEPFLLPREQQIFAIPRKVLSLHRERLKLYQTAESQHPEVLGRVIGNALQTHLKDFTLLYSQLIFDQNEILSNLHAMDQRFQLNYFRKVGGEGDGLDLIRFHVTEEIEAETETMENQQEQEEQDTEQEEQELVKNKGIKHAVVLPLKFFSDQARVLHRLMECLSSGSKNQIGSVLQIMIAVFGMDRMGGKQLKLQGDHLVGEMLLQQVCRTKGLFGSLVPSLVYCGEVEEIKASKQKKRRYLLLTENGLIICKLASPQESGSDSAFKFRRLIPRESFIAGDPDEQSYIIKLTVPPKKIEEEIEKKERREREVGANEDLIIDCGSKVGKVNWLLFFSCCSFRTISSHLVDNQDLRSINLDQIKQEIVHDIFCESFELWKESLQISRSQCDDYRVYEKWLSYDNETYNYEALSQALFNETKIHLNQADKKKKGKGKVTRTLFHSNKAVVWLMRHAGVSRKKAIDIGQHLIRLGTISPVSDGVAFEDKPNLFQFSDQRVLNLSSIRSPPLSGFGSECKLSEELLKELLKIYQIFSPIASEYGNFCALSLLSIHHSFKQFQNNVCQLQRIDLTDIDNVQKTGLLINVHNLLNLHSFVYLCGHSQRKPLVLEGTERLTPINPLPFQCHYKYRIGSFVFSSVDLAFLVKPQSTQESLHLSLVERENKERIERERKGGKSKPNWPSLDARWSLKVSQPSPLTVFALCNYATSSPSGCPLQFHSIFKQLEVRACDYLLNSVRIWWQSQTLKLTLPKLMEWYREDFGAPIEIVHFLSQVLNNSSQKSLLEKVIEALKSEDHSDLKKKKVDKPKRTNFSLRGKRSESDRSSLLASSSDSIRVPSLSLSSQTPSSDPLSSPPSSPTSTFFNPQSEGVSVLNQKGPSTASASVSVPLSVSPRAATKGGKSKSKTTKTNIRIDYSDYSDGFKYPGAGVSMSEELQTSFGGAQMMKVHSFLSSSGEKLFMREEMVESKYAFELPHQFLQFSSKWQQSNIKKISVSMAQMTAQQEQGSFGEQDSLLIPEILERRKKVVKERSEYLLTIQTLITLYNHYDASYNGLTYKPSTYKGDTCLQCIATNLHTHIQRVSLSPFPEIEPISETMTPIPNETVYDFVTFGAPAAHVYKFRGKNLKQLLERHKSKLEKLQNFEEQLSSLPTQTRRSDKGHLSIIFPNSTSNSQSTNPSDQNKHSVPQTMSEFLSQNVSIFTCFDPKPLFGVAWDDDIDDVLLDEEAIDASIRDRDNIRRVMGNCRNPDVGLAVLRLDLEELHQEIDLRLDSSFSQVLGAIVTSVSQRLLLIFHQRDPIALEQYFSIGLLVHFESLLSTAGAENGMLGDMDAVICILKRVSLLVVEKKENSEGEGADNQITVTYTPNFVSEDQGESEECDFFELERQLRYSAFDKSPSLAKPLYILTFHIPSAIFDPLRSRVQQDTLVSLVPTLFTQGINEQQSKAIMLGQTQEQERINKANLEILNHYSREYLKWVLGRGKVGSGMTKKELLALGHEVPLQEGVSLEQVIVKEMTKEMDFLREVITRSHREKNTHILSRSADFSRKLRGLRLTSCKSAKDRTSMSITWEMARILQQCHSLPADKVMPVARSLRSEGLRLENAGKNIGKKKFAFNKLQRSMIPEEYQAQRSVCADTRS